MSGGSWNYFFAKLNDVAFALAKHETTEYEDMGQHLNEEQKAARQTLSKVLLELSDVMKDIEWVDSGDTTFPQDVDSINKFLDYMKSENYKENATSIEDD